MSIPEILRPSRLDSQIFKAQKLKICAFKDFARRAFKNFARQGWIFWMFNA